MTNKKAIRVIKNIEHYLATHTNESCEEEHTALEIAIKAIEERPTGKWLPRTAYDGYTYWRCDKCNVDVDDTTDFCPHCGAKMEKGEEE